MTTLILTAISGIVGIVGTVIAYRLSPQRKIDELNAHYVTLVNLEKKLIKERDDALAKNDTDGITNAVSSLEQLHYNQNDILQRLRAYSVQPK